MLAFQASLPTHFGLREIRHVRFDHTGRDCIYADTSGPGMAASFDRVSNALWSKRKQGSKGYPSRLPNYGGAPTEEITMMFEPST